MKNKAVTVEEELDDSTIEKFYVPYEKEKAREIFKKFSLAISRLGLCFNSSSFYKFFSSISNTFCIFGEDIDKYSLSSNLKFGDKNHRPNPRTIILEKNRNIISIECKKGYNSYEEELIINPEEGNDYSRNMYLCQRGINTRHIPYEPSKYEKWRYGHSKVKFSYKEENNDIYVSIEDKFYDKPKWYSVYSKVIGNNCCKTVLDLDKQPDHVHY